MSKEHTISLTKAEISHVLNLIQTNDYDCTYYGHPDQYWKRSERIKSKLKRADRANIITTQDLKEIDHE